MNESRGDAGCEGFWDDSIWDIDSTMTLIYFCTVESRGDVTVDSHGGDLITVTEPVSSWFRYPRNLLCGLQT